MTSVGGPGFTGDRDVDPTAVVGPPDLSLTKRSVGTFTVGLPGSYEMPGQPPQEGKERFEHSES